MDSEVYRLSNDDFIPAIGHCSKLETRQLGKTLLMSFGPICMLHAVAHSRTSTAKVHR
jgi:hypothetical protein